MKFAHVIFLIVFFAAALNASVFDHPLKQENKSSLESFVSQMTSKAVVHGDFKQTRSIKKMNRQFVSTGKFAIVNGSGILWKTEKPFASKLWVSENGITQTDLHGNEKKLPASENPVFAEFSRTIQSLFSGKLNELENKFEIYFEIENNMVSVGLVPREKAVRGVIASITMAGKRNIEKIVIVDAEGNLVEYEFSNQKFEKNLNDDVLKIYQLPKP